MKWKSIFGSSLIPLNAVLLIFLLFENRLVVPPWLQSFGRLHPMILHFPIVLIIGYTLWEGVMAKRVGPPTPSPDPVAETLLLAAAFTASITAIMGLLLAAEPAYEGAAVGWHKWLGTLISFGLLAAWSFRGSLRALPRVTAAMGICLTVLVLVAGHLGGTITHGEGFVLAPVFPAKGTTRAALEDAFVFKDLVDPILESKCRSCHNSSNAKGGLSMDSKELLLKGGKDGKLWDTADISLGLLLTRIHLPPEEKKHMPPANKTQLSQQEQSILYAWIRGGADFDKKVLELSPTDTLRILASGILKSAADEKYDFAAAAEKKVQELNTNYRVIAPLATGSPALAVDFYGAASFQPQQVKDLEPLKEQIVSLNLSKMPLADKDLATVATFRNLRELNLSFTAIRGAGLPALAKLSHLKSLRLSGTGVKTEDIAELIKLKSLRTLYIWNTGIHTDGIASLRKARGDGDLAIITGFVGDTVHLKLNAPRIETEERVIHGSLALQLKHFVPGATIRYTLDGSDPDSGGVAYNGPVQLNNRAVLKAKAYKKGWLASDAVNANFFSFKYRADSILLLKPVDSNYMKYSPRVLVDLDKGDMGFNSGKWLGFRKKGLECLLFFKQAAKVEEITLSGLVDINSYIMPPVSLEVWGGNSKDNLRLLGSLHPEQPTKSQPAYQAAYDIRFPATSVHLLKVVARPVDKLPDWHAGKGKNGWIMTDELFIN
jgi:uncharacterized membrane protein